LIKCCPIILYIPFKVSELALSLYSDIVQKSQTPGLVTKSSSFMPVFSLTGIL